MSKPVYSGNANEPEMELSHFENTGILPDSEIEWLSCEEGMIQPFIGQKVSKGVLSYGLSSFGYDIRLATEFKFPKMVVGGHLDPKRPDQRMWHTDTITEPFMIPPQSCCLAKSVERFSIPEDVIAIAIGKSTYARCFVTVLVTPIEPGWKGVLTIEIANLASVPVTIYPNEGILQLLFFRGDEAPVHGYGAGGKFQNQIDEPVLGFVR